MIKSIDSIHNLGIYKDFNTNSIKPFKQYNLFYGWNGSGKSTVARMLGFLSEQNIPEDFSSVKFKISTDEGTITEKNRSDFIENIRTFNSDFIEANIDWNGAIQSILLLSEDKIDTIKEFNLLKSELYGTEDKDGLIKTIENRHKEIEAFRKSLDKDLSATAKSVKNSLQLIDTSDTYFSNYNKARVDALLKEKKLSPTGKLSDKEIETLAQEARPIKKNIISDTVSELNKEQFQGIAEKAKSILSIQITAQVIQELKDNAGQADWVEQGLKINKTRKTCAFCGGTILEKRINDLEAHFNDALTKFKEQIKTFITECGNSKVIENYELVKSVYFYDEY